MTEIAEHLVVVQTKADDELVRNVECDEVLPNIDCARHSFRQQKTGPDLPCAEAFDGIHYPGHGETGVHNVVDNLKLCGGKPSTGTAKFQRLKGTYQHVLAAKLLGTAEASDLDLPRRGGVLVASCSDEVNEHMRAAVMTSHGQLVYKDREEAVRSFENAQQDDRLERTEM